MLDRNNGPEQVEVLPPGLRFGHNTMHHQATEHDDHGGCAGNTACESWNEGGLGRSVVAALGTTIPRDSSAGFTGMTSSALFRHIGKKLPAPARHRATIQGSAASIGPEHNSAGG